MDAAGENARLHRRAVLRARARSAGGRRRGESSRSSRRPSASAPTRPASARAAAERRDVVRGVAGAAADDLGRVVLQDQHRRFARHAGDFAVDELVGDEVADDQHAAAREAVDEREQPLLALGLAGQRMDGARDQHCGFRFQIASIADCRRIQLAAAARLSTTASAATPAGGRVSSARRSRSAPGSPRAPTVRAEPHVEPPVADDERARRVDAEVARRAIDEAARRLPAVADAREAGDLAVRMVRTIVIRVDARAARREQRRRCGGASPRRPPR